MNNLWRLLFCLALSGATFLAYAAIFESPPKLSREEIMVSHFVEGKFRNLHPIREMNFLGSVHAWWLFLTGKSADSVPGEAIAVQSLTENDLRQAPEASLWRLGHSTVLFKLDGKFWITDPVFAERVSPVSFTGPQRFHAPPLARGDLPEIEAVILSHDHYDHLDQETVLAIEPRVKHFLAPLGVGDRLIAWGIPAEKVRQLDWWEEAQIGAVSLIATPAQHFSGRSLTDRNTTLWASWVVKTPETRVFFSGDSGYFDGFKTIGDRFGPFDVTLIENGAYNQAWADIHMQPEQTLQAHLDLRGRTLVPIHNGTFDLALHAWTEPLERIVAIAKDKDVALSTPRIGERLDIRQPGEGMAWWRTSEPGQPQPVAANSRVNAEVSMAIVR